MPTAVVTGGSGAIGAALVRRLHAGGVRVINVDREPPPVENPAAAFVQADFRDLEATREVLTALAARERVSLLVNNAGVALPASLEGTSLADYRTVLDVNVGASIVCAQALVPAMKAARHGRIVNITSRAALGKPLRTSYSSAKAGVVGLTRTLALELAAWGITVNAVGPGPIETPLFRSANPPDSPRTAAILEGIPLRRLGTPDDVAAAAAFFLGDEASFVTGQVLYVCGGLSLGSG
jgi:3-oxoacyl-[acyl-carrier protein] reductase